MAPVSRPKEIIIQTVLATFSYPIPILIGHFIDLYLNMPGLGIPYMYSHVTGSVLMALGSLIILMATRDLIVFGIGTPNPSFPSKVFVKKGLYEYIRHPIYLGWVALLLGAVFYFNSLLILEAAAIVAIFIYFYTSREEKELEERFGRKYKEYEKTVPKFLPRIRRLQLAKNASDS